MRIAESRGALRRNLGGAPSEWTDELLDGAVARAVEDLDRLLPQEKIDGQTLIFDISAETWGSGTLGSTVTLANKRLRPKSESVTDVSGATTYERDVDYTMDYALGTIVALTSGSIPADQADLLITYKILEVYLDLSALTDLIRVIRVEYPAGNIPGDFQSFYTWGDFLVVMSMGTQTQSRLNEKEHAWLYYHAKHTVPEITADSSWPPQIDEVVIKGAESYSLMTKALELRHSAKNRLATALTTLGEVTAIEAEIDTALANTASQASGSTSDLEDIDGYITDMIATLAAASGFLASAGNAVISALAQAALAENNITAADADLTTAGGKLSDVDALVTDATALLATVETFVAKAGSPLDVAKSNLSAALTLADEIEDGSVGVNQLLLQSSGRLDTAAFRLADADDFSKDAVSTLITALSTDLTDLIPGVGTNIVIAKANLVTGLTKIDRVNQGELVSEMYKRYADSSNAVARMRYDEHLAYLGRIDRVLAQGTGMIAQAAEYRAQGDVYVSEARTALEFMNVLLGQVRAYHENIAQNISLAQGHINSGQVMSGAAASSAGLVNSGINQGRGYIEIARVRLEQAREDNVLVEAYLTAATAYVNMANAKIAEGNGKRTPIDATLAMVEHKLDVARVYQTEAGVRIQEIAAKHQEADRHVNLSLQESSIADKFEERGVIIKAEFMEILMDRAQVRADTALTPTRQQAT
ncbi:hypothetical protein LCGC14_0987970 [marine sediment metagenome]|uniref:Uncharacterized protein n=1 Tax=marine sediment metagenome TaxID=412755 RepID=A0A0F9NTA8_9ZZZZ